MENKKYINGCCNYTGSKFKLLEQIIPEMDFSKSIFVDLFCGSFVVGSNVIDKYESIFANDIIKDLVDIHYNIINDFDNFILEVKSLVVSKEDQLGFNLLRSSFNTNKSAAKLYALLLCSTNNMLRFNNSFLYNQTFGKRTYNPSTEKKLNEYYTYIKDFKDKITFESKHFSDINVVNSMVYMDPPYSNSEAGYNSFWKKDDDNKLYNYIKKLDLEGSSFMISGVKSHDGKSCVLLDKLISDGYYLKELNFNYNKVSRKGNKETIEIIIKNYKK